MSVDLNALQEKLAAEKARRGMTADTPLPGAESSAPQPGAPAPDLPDLETPGPAPAPDTSTAQRLMSLEPTFVGGGSMVGGAIGQVATGPEPMAGMIGGGALGAMAGKAAFENMLDIARRFGVEGLPPPPSLVNRFEDMVKEGTIDLAFSAGVPMVSSIIRGGRKALASSLGVTAEGRQMAQEVKDNLDVLLSPAQVSSGKAPEFFTKVLARFPLFGGPARANVKRTMQETMAAKDRLFLRLGPSANMAELGIDLNKATDTRFKAFRRQINRLYENARTLAEKNNARVPTEEIRSKALDSLLTLTQRQPILRETGETLAKDSPVMTLLDRISKLDDTLDINQYDGFLQNLDEAMAQAKKDGFKVSALMDVKKTAEAALNNLTDPAAAKAFQEADATFARTMAEVFETPTAQKAGRVAKGRFAVGQMTKAGGYNPDESFKLLYNAKSADGLRDLRKLVGPRRFQASVRAHFDQVFEQAALSGRSALEEGRKGMGFDFGKWRQQIGIGRPHSAEYTATQEAIKGTGVSMKKLELWTDTLENVLKTVPDDVNSFIARRGTMGGLRSIITALAPTAAGTAVGGVSGAMGTIGATLMVRKAGAIITSPKLLELSRTVLNQNATFQARKAALRVLAESTGMAGELREAFPEFYRAKMPEAEFSAL